MPPRALATGGLLLLAVLCLCVPRSATAQVTSPDQLCSPEADPCVVSSAQTVASGTRLDFGDRTLRITPSGRLNALGGDMSIVARELQLEASGQINQSGSSTVSGGSLDLEVTEFVNIAGTINLNGDSGGFLSAQTMRFDVASTGSVLLNSVQEFGSGGTLDLSAGEVNFNGRVQLNASGDGTGGTATLQIDRTFAVRGVFEAKGGESDGGSIDVSSGGAVTVSDLGSIRLDASGAGGGGDLTLIAGDVSVGPGAGTLVVQGTVSSGGGGATEGGGDAGSLDLSAAEDCLITGRLLAIGGPGAGGGDITVACSEVAPGDLTMSAEVDVHGGGSDGGGGSVELDTSNGSIEISNKINANGGIGGGGSVAVTASSSISVSDRINVSSAGAAAGDVALSALGLGDAIITLTSSGSITADGSGPEGEGGSISLESCTTRVALRSGGQSASATGVVGSGSISLTGVNRISIAGRLTSSNDIMLIYRDFDPFLESTAVVVPAPVLVLNEALQGCGTPQPTRTRTLTPTVPTATPTFTRPILTSTPTRTVTPTPTGPTVTPTPRPTPAGPNDANCNGILASDETPGVIEGTFDASFLAICANSDANGDGRVNAADLTSIISKITAAPPQ
jgi:hypothetical protein